ncbi:MAG: FkbM family methyltransferase [Pseudomonadota bacterium]
MNIQASPDPSAILNDKLDRLLRLTEQQLNIQRLIALGPEKNFTFNYRGENISMHLPQGDRDFIQRRILTIHSFYETPFLEAILSAGVVAPGGVIVDAGANIGNHSVFFGRFLQASKVISFEPQPAVFETLQKNLDLNGIPGKAHRVMLGAQKGEGAIDVFKPQNHGGTSFKAVEGGGTPMTTIDATLTKTDRSKLKLIKIDVEGAQLDVLKGAQASIEAAKPVIWCEVFADERAETESLLKGMGYRATKILKGDNAVFVHEG